MRGTRRTPADNRQSGEEIEGPGEGRRERTIRGVEKSRRRKQKSRTRKRRNAWSGGARGREPIPWLLFQARQDGEVWKARGNLEDRRKGEFLWKGKREVAEELQAARGPERTERRGRESAKERGTETKRQTLTMRKRASRRTVRRKDGEGRRGNAKGKRLNRDGQIGRVGVGEY